MNRLFHPVALMNELIRKFQSKVSRKHEVFLNFFVSVSVG